MKPASIDTAAKRARLQPRKNPYWAGIAGGRGGVSLGYRRAKAGPGVWIAKTIAFGGRTEERIGVADDTPLADGSITYKAAVALALDWGARQQEALEAEASTARRTTAPTVRSAVESYIAVRKKRSKTDGANAESRLTLHVLSDAEISNTKLARLRSSCIEEWVDRLVETSDMAATTINRLLNDVRAALNAAATRHRRLLPAHVFQEIKFGTKALEAPPQARRQLLTDDQVVAAIDAAFAVDDSGDFGRLVLVLAATGARYSQARRAQVSALQPSLSRIMMPSSRKGRNEQSKPPAAIPLDAGVMGRLAPVLEGREEEAALLERWAYRRTGKGTWGRDCRRAWGPSGEVDRWWSQTIKKAALPAGTVMYALRHTSIVRGLRAMLPVRLVAALHDTSVEMIEQHYAAFIVDVTEDLARRATLSMSPMHQAA